MLNNHVPASYLPRNYNRKNVMNDTNGSRYDCKYLHDEIYISDICVRKNISQEMEDNGRKYHVQTIGNNPQNAWYADGKYYYDFPSIWFNSNSVNKAIGVRSIDVKLKPLFFSWKVEIYPDDNPDGIYTHTFNYNAPSDLTSEQIASNMAFLMNKWLTPLLEDTTILYVWLGGIVKFNLRTPIDNLVFDIIPNSYDFRSFFGEPEKIEYAYDVNNNIVNEEEEEDIENLTYGYCNIYVNVWDRKNVYLHASFVNYTSFNYLGKDGEFYNKISKIYNFNTGTAINFYFEVSDDGMTIMRNAPELGISFEVGLCFIIDDKKYLGD